MKLLSRQSQTEPGVWGVARVARRADNVIGRVGHGDIVVFEQPDIDKTTAETLVRAGVTGVINVASSISGRYPNLGPEILINAGVVLVDITGDDIFSQLKDGTKIRLYDGAVYAGDVQLGTGVEHTTESIADLMIEAKAGMSAQLEAFAANAIEYMQRERTLLLDGVGIPELACDVDGRPVLVVAPSRDTAAELKSLRKFIADYHPVLVGVDGGGDALRNAGFMPDILVGNPEQMSDDVLHPKNPKHRPEVVIPADVDGHAPGLERLQDLGLGAVTFPASGTAEDLALLLVHAHGAALMVTAGMRTSLTSLLDRGHGNAASSFLVRLKVADRIVEANTVAKLFRPRVSASIVLLLIVAAAIAIASAIIYADVSGTYAEGIRQGFNSVIAWIKGLF